MREKGISLKYKFILAFIAFAVLLSLTFALIAVHHLSSRLEEQFLHRGREIAERLAEESFCYT
jgi:hypothetical protein